MNFYTPITMRAELGKPVSLLPVFLQGPAVVRMPISETFVYLTCLTCYMLHAFQILI